MGSEPIAWDTSSTRGSHLSDCVHLGGVRPQAYPRLAGTPPEPPRVLVGDYLGSLGVAASCWGLVFLVWCSEDRGRTIGFLGWEVGVSWGQTLSRAGWHIAAGRW